MHDRFQKKDNILTVLLNKAKQTLIAVLPNELAKNVYYSDVGLLLLIGSQKLFFIVSRRLMKMMLRLFVY